MTDATTNTDTPRIYVACLAAYNNGKLHGEWIDANQDADDIYTEINAMLAESPEPDAEEFAIHDYEYFHGISIHEYASIPRVAEVAELITQYGEAFALWLAYIGGVDELDDDTAETFEDAYYSLYDEVEEFAQERYQFVTIPQELKAHVNWSSVARDLFCGNWFAIRGREGVHVYSNT
jgi:antirestriction protein